VPRKIDILTAVSNDNETVSLYHSLRYLLQRSFLFIKYTYILFPVQFQSGGAWRKESVDYNYTTQRGGDRDRTDYLCSDLHRLRKGADHRLVEGAVSSD